MKATHHLFATLILATFNLSAGTLYVSLESTNPTTPYTNWATAAHVIQDAVDAAVAGDTVLVTNGLYVTGGRAVGTNLLSDRVAIEKPIRLESVNGPAVTIIKGAPAPAGNELGNGDGAVRCVYLGLTNAVLSGFTLTNGHTRTSGDYERDQCGGGVWGGTWDKAGGVLTNCVLTGNSAYQGGGAYSGALNNCTLSGNSAYSGGGAAYATLNNCTLTGNSALYDGGGAFEGTLNNCTLAGNSAFPDEWGYGGSGGGARWGTLNNCIVYFNTAPTEANYSGSTLNYCCTTPLPGGGIGNIALDPQLASATHLSASSPCRGAGSAAYVSGTDIDGEPWATPPSIGCDEFHAGAMTGPLNVGIVAAFTNVATGYAVSFTAVITGRILESVWDFGDGTLATNQPFAAHAWGAPGAYTVRLTGYNDSFPGGVSTTVKITVSEVVHYVDSASTNPVFPYSSWQTAARNIQDAIDSFAAGTVPGAVVLVTNGVYRVGKVELNGTNRVALTNILVVRSANGPEQTIIEGETNGVRCAWVGNGAVLSGFTLTKGNSESGGGVWCEPWAVVTNCVLSGNSATYNSAGYNAQGGGVHGGTLYNCVLMDNSADYGGGASGSTLYNCALTGNWANFAGGGASADADRGNPATLHNCVLAGNSAGYGGGVYQGTLHNCTLTGNSAGSGGGAYYSTLNNCTLTGNSAVYSGGGGEASTLYNCTVTGNSAQLGGGVAATSSGGPGCLSTVALYNCTITGNSAQQGGGVASIEGGGCGVIPPPLRNCIVYLNRAPVGANYSAGDFAYSCTTPLPPGPGNIASDPLLVTASHLAPNSPCTGAGSPAYASGVDIDGEPWANPPAMGADQPGSASGPFSLVIQANWTNVTPGYPVSFTALNTGSILQSVWDFGDGTLATNQPVLVHAWSAPGAYNVRLIGYNASYPDGVSTTVTITVSNAVHYVNAASANPVFPYTSWPTAARTIQDAIEAAGTVPGAVVLVTNGVYRVGKVELNHHENRVALTNIVLVRSANGPEQTIIEGETNGVRCAWVGNGAVLSGFTLRKGNSESGGGVWCEPLAVVTNCVLTGNSSQLGGGGAAGGTLKNCTLTGNSAQLGGGAYGGRLNNCTLTGNSAVDYGGGAYGGTLKNCTLTDNSAEYGGGAVGGTLNNCTLTGNSAGWSGGGAAGGTLNNCIVYFNSAPNAANYYQDEYSGILNYCCTTPLPAGGTGNITLDPQLASTTHLSASSPCRGAGSAAYVSGTDIDGEPWAAPPSIGCDEYHAGVITGPLNVSIVASYTNVTVGYTVGFTALVDGRTTASQWDFGDGVVSSNRPYASHAWSGTGDYLVVLRAFNEDHPGGVSAAVTVHVVVQPVFYVAATSNNPQVPYDSWGRAATNLQDAVDAVGLVGGVTGTPLVLVTNGVYGTGGRPVGTNLLSNRVAIEKPIRLESVNGPAVTIIEGARAPAGDELGNGDGAVRCVYLGLTNAVLSGFTLTNGATRTVYDYPTYRESGGGGVWCEGSAVVSNCVVLGNSAGVGGGAFKGTLYNCTLSGNSAKSQGGGAFKGTLYSCTLSGNSAIWGGGAYGGTLNNCTLSGNSANHAGGGACGGTLYNCTLTGNSAQYYGGGASVDQDLGNPITLYNCTLTGNSAQYGGGAYGGALYTCTLTGNTAADKGGGAFRGTLYNCILSGNSAYWGGGTYGGTLNNCTLTGNSAQQYGGGASVDEVNANPTTLYNCIVYFNTAVNGANYHQYYDGILKYCCTTPLPISGLRNISGDPRFLNAAAGDFRLRPDSPCIDTGSNANAGTSSDILGLPRVMDGNNDGIARVDMGAYEFNPYRFEPVLRLTVEGFHFTVRGEPGRNVRIERSADLLHWEFAGEVPIPASGQTLIDPAATSESKLFYRAMRVP